MISGCICFSLETFLSSFYGLSVGFMEYGVSLSCVYSVNNLFFTKDVGSLVYVRIRGAGDTC